MRDHRFPAQLQQQLRVVERPGRGVDDVAVDRAGFAVGERLLTELEEVALTDVTLPAIRAEPIGRIDAAGGIVDLSRDFQSGRNATRGGFGGTISVCAR